MHKRQAPIGRRKFLKTASLAGAAVLSARAAQAQEPNPTADPMEDPSSGSAPVFSPDTPASSLVNPGKPMPSDITAAQVREALQLEPSEIFGYARDTYRSALYVAPGGLPAPFQTGRPLGGAQFFMVTPHAPVKLHRVENDQLYHYYGGDPIEVLMLYESGTSELTVIGSQRHRRPARAAVRARRHVPHRARHRPPPLVPGRRHVLARHRPGPRRGVRRSRDAGRAISGSRERFARLPDAARAPAPGRTGTRARAAEMPRARGSRSARVAVRRRKPLPSLSRSTSCPATILPIEARSPEAYFYLR